MIEHPWGLMTPEQVADTICTYSYEGAQAMLREDIRAACEAQRAAAVQRAEAAERALRPFAAYADVALSGGLRENYVLDQIHGKARVTLGDCIAARAALSAAPAAPDADESGRGGGA